MSAGMLNEQSFEKHIEKQMGCMTGFLHIFDRHQIFSGKRHHSTKRLPPSPLFDTTSESENSAPASPAISREVRKLIPPSPERYRSIHSPEFRSPLQPPKSPLQEGTRNSWRFSKEAPRLSLDSRATTDAKGSLHPKEMRTVIADANRCDSIASDESQTHRSPSVVARLMGLEPLPDSSCTNPEPKPELRRSASESRVSRDLFYSRLISERNNFSSHHETQIANHDSPQFADPVNYLLKNANKVDTPKAFNRGGFTSSSPWNAQRLRKSFFDSGDFFPVQKQIASIYGEVENRLKLRGIVEPSKDLETLKQILEALHLKGLLQSRKQPEQAKLSHRNFVYEDSHSPIVPTKTSRLPNSAPLSRRISSDYSCENQTPGARKNYAGGNPHSMSSRNSQNVRSPTWTGRSPSPNPTTSNRAEANAVGRRPNLLAKPKQLIVETHRRTNESVENRRFSQGHSPKNNSRGTGRDSTVNRLPRNSELTAEIHRKEKKAMAAEDETSSISGSSITTSTDTERWKTEELKDGRNLLERCDKLVQSIAEMNGSDMQPSPVSVLDSSFYKDESSTPSPTPVTTRRNLDFKDDSGELEDEVWSPDASPLKGKEDGDLVYISEILRASQYLPEESDVFILLEKQQYLKGKDICKESRLERKLIFNSVHEILERNRRLPPWKVAEPSLDMVWSEFQRMRQHSAGEEDLFDTICSVIMKDLAGDWGDCPVEMSLLILDVERLVFKDLINEAIRDLVALEPRNSSPSMMPRRKLVF